MAGDDMGYWFLAVALEKPPATSSVDRGRVKSEEEGLRSRRTLNTVGDQRVILQL
jgi:hypothetical protein